MPLILIDALPSGQAVVNTDEILLIRQDGSRVEIVLRGESGYSVRVPHESVADVAQALDNIENLVLRKVVQI